MPTLIPKNICHAILLLAILINGVEANDYAFLSNAIREGNLEKVRQILPEDRVADYAITGASPMNVATVEQQLEIMRYLGRAGANINEENSRGHTLLMQAAIRGKTAAVEVLLELGADPQWIDRRDQDVMDLLFSAKRWDRDMISLLAQNGAALNRTRNSGSLLQQAVSRQDGEMARFLLESGADPNVAGPLGDTPLFVAVSKGDTEMAAHLVSAGARTDVKVFGMSLADTAKMQGNEALAAILQHSPGSDASDVRTAANGLQTSGQPQPQQRSQASGAPQQRRRDDNPAQPPATYRGLLAYKIPDLTHHGKPEIRDGASCEKIGQVGTSGEEFLDGFRVFPESGNSLGVSGETIHLPPGEYRLQRLSSVTAWKWLCSGVLHSTTGDKTSLWSLRRETVRSAESNHRFSLKGDGPAPKPDEPEPTKIRIETPEVGAQFSFDDSAEGVLVFRASADVSPPEKADAVIWKMEDVNGAEIKFIPERGADVEVRIKGLPANSRDFGSKTLSARVGGSSDQLEVQVFFDPRAKNHPGAGSNHTPNWFYYWGQTSAGRDFDLKYKPEASQCLEGTPIGRYIYKQDTIFLYDALIDGRCTTRSSTEGVAVAARGFDCFGETVRHEHVHRDELRYWWKDLALPPPGCSDWEIVSVNIPNKLAGIDSDLDMVPDYIEKALAGCDPEDRFSCPGRPQHINVPDVEMNAYRIGWKQWPIGNADEEDWSRCGKQWTYTACS